MCKHYDTPQGCSYGEKCQFAHGQHELRLNPGQVMPQAMMGMNPKSTNKIQNSLLNYKIVKCKNWERDKTCKYGAHCSFAHGDQELRNKNDNLCNMHAPIPMIMPMLCDMNGMPMNIQQGGMDMAQLQQIMAANPNQNSLMMGMNFYPINPNIPNPNKANENDQEEKDKEGSDYKKEE